MKKGLHPENYRPVVFKDMSNGDMFLSRSTCKTNDTVMFEGQEYPVVKLKSLTPLTPSTQVRTSWWTPPVAWTSS